MSERIDIRKFVKENPAVVYGVAAIVAALVVYVIFFAPLLKKLGIKYTECRNCENQLWEARNTIEYAASLDRSAGARVLISEKEASSGIEELTKFGKSLGIAFSGIKPGDVVYGSGSSYKIMPVELNMEANGDQFVKFMGSVDELKKAIVRMKSFNITPDSNDRNMLKINLIVEIYLSPGSEAAG